MMDQAQRAIFVGRSSIVLAGNIELPRLFVVIVSGRVKEEAPAKGSQPPKRDRTERKTNAPREGAIWKCVEVTREHATSPAVGFRLRLR